MYKTRTLKILPTVEQQKHLTEISNASRWTYNWAKEMLETTNYTKFDLYKLFTKIKPKYDNVVELVYHRRAINQAYVAFMRAKKDKGEMKNKLKKNEGFLMGANVKPVIKKWNVLSIPAFKKLKTESLKLHSIPNVKSFNVIFKNNKYYIQINYETIKQTNTIKKKNIIKKGIDVGMEKPFVICTAINEEIQNITSYLNSNKKQQLLVGKINYYKSELSRKHKNSGHFKRQKKQIRDLYNNLNHLRDQAEKFLAKCVVGSKTSEIIMEDIKIKNLTKHTGNKKRTFNRKLLAQRHYSTIQAIKRRAEKTGTIFTQINAAYTSQRCFACGFISKENRQSQSEFLCISCAYRDNADANAACNITFKKDKTGVNERDLLKRELDSKSHAYLCETQTQGLNSFFFKFKFKKKKRKSQTYRKPNERQSNHLSEHKKNESVVELYMQFI